MLEEKENRQEKNKILIVDDVEINREMLRSILEDQYEIYEASNGQEAINLLEEKKRTYHLILLDLIMPVKDGYSVLEYMAKNKLDEEIPVIIITGDSTKETILKAYENGAQDVFFKPYIPEIVIKRIENVLHLYNHKYRDALTGGLNRRAFIKEVGYRLNMVENPKEYSLMFFNIKNFKAVNELFGIQSGDQILKKFYDGLQNSAMEPVLTTRLEADRFACLVKTDHIDLERLSHSMKENVTIKGKKIRMFALCGIYNIEDNQLTVSAMIDRAKLAKQHIMDELVRPYAIYDDSMKADYVDQAEALSEFETGIENEEFKVYYQPVIDANTGKIVSAEALVRWNHPTKGFVSPGMFIPVLEKNGHITALDRYMLQRVNASLHERSEKGLPTVPISVNLSWMDFYDDNMVQKIIELLQIKEIAHNRIRLEVTETSYAALEQNRAKLIDNLRMFGAVVLLDDFGSGYSSFGMLEDYNFDILKIDMSFVKKIEEKEKSRIIIRGIIDMCHEMGIKVVAEGAETEEQVRFLRENACDYIQGFYYSKPLPEEEFAKFIERNLAAV